MEIWIILGIILLLTCVIIFIIYHNTSNKYYGLCPKCHKEFKPYNKAINLYNPCFR